MGEVNVRGMRKVISKGLRSEMERLYDVMIHGYPELGARCDLLLVIIYAHICPF